MGDRQNGDRPQSRNPIHSTPLAIPARLANTRIPIRILTPVSTNRSKHLSASTGFYLLQSSYTHGDFEHTAHPFVEQLCSSVMLSISGKSRIPMEGSDRTMHEPIKAQMLSLNI